MHGSQLVVIGAILFALITGYEGHKNISSENERIIERIDSLMVTANQAGDFNGNILIARNDKVIYEASFGFSDSTKTMLKDTDKFLIGSIYKEIPGVSIMQLHERNLLSLNDRLSEYFPGLPNWAENITIHHLLQYMSGLPKVNWGRHREVSDDVLINDLEEITKLEFKPGEGYLYTNYSPFLLAKIVERVTNRSFTDYVQENILSPNGLNQTVFKNQFPYINREAMAISLNAEYKEDYPPFEINTPLFLFSTTTKDLYKWVQSLHAFEIIREESVKTLAEPAQIKDENIQSLLGTVKFAEGRLVEHSHHGSSGNYESLLKEYKSKGLPLY